MATPEQCKQQVLKEYQHLMSRVAKKQINASCVYGIIKARAQEAAAHGGIPEYWREYMPDELS